MSRYIDADALENAMYNKAFETDTEMQRWDSGCWIRYKLFETVLEEQPTADVVEVIRGEWIQHDEGVYQEKEKNWWHCSNCGNVIYSEHEDDRKEFHKWCGRCGAYMRGENDAEIH